MKGFIISLVFLTTIICLASCSSQKEIVVNSEIDNLIAKEMGNGHEKFFVVLNDMGSNEDGSLWHQYEIHVLPENKDEAMKVIKTEKIPVSSITFEKHFEHLGMEVAQFQNGSITHDIGPLGFSMLVNNPSFGEWRMASDSVEQENELNQLSSTEERTTNSDTTRSRSRRSFLGSGLIWFWLGRNSSMYSRNYNAATPTPKSDYTKYQNYKNRGLTYFGTSPDGTKKYGTGSSTNTSRKVGSNWHSLSKADRVKTRSSVISKAKSVRNSGRVRGFRGRSGGFGK